MQMSIRESLLQIPALRSRCPLPGLAEKGILLPKQSLLFSPSFPNRKEGERGQCCSEFSFLLFVYISHPGERKQLLTSVPALFERERKALEKGESVADVGRFPPTQMSCSEESSAWGLGGQAPLALGHASASAAQGRGKAPPDKGPYSNGPESREQSNHQQRNGQRPPAPTRRGLGQPGATGQGDLATSPGP